MVGTALTDQLATLYAALQLAPQVFAIIAAILVLLSVRSAASAMR